MIRNEPLVSVVVPIYKAEVWLRDCIDSILAQTLRNIEVILVDDGSPDSCGEICDEYASKDKRVRVIHKDNSGVSIARKTGVDNANADYISFVDADDTIPTTALEDLYLVGGVESDIVIGSHFDKIYDKEFLTPQENRYYSIAWGEGQVWYTAWAKLIARHLFDENTFPSKEVVNSEDVIMSIRVAFANKKPVRLVSKKVYNYNLHQDSASHTSVFSIDSESLYYKNLIDSIPMEQRETYAKACIVSCFHRLRFVYNSQHCNVWYGTAYYKNLMECAKRCGYRLPLTHRIKLRITNASLLRFYMLCENFLTYRYGLLKNMLK